jgi:hypothetical protein
MKHKRGFDRQFLRLDPAFVTLICRCGNYSVSLNHSTAAPAEQVVSFTPEGTCDVLLQLLTVRSQLNCLLSQNVFQNLHHRRQFHE